MTLGQLLKTTRISLSKTLREVETLTGISNGYLSQLESDLIKQPSPNHLHKLASVYGVAYARLMELAGYAVERPIASAYGAYFNDVNQLEDDLTEEDRKKIHQYIEDLRDARRSRKTERPSSGTGSKEP